MLLVVVQVALVKRRGGVRAGWLGKVDAKDGQGLGGNFDLTSSMEGDTLGLI